MKILAISLNGCICITMIVVVDSNVIYSGLYSRRGASFQILRAIRNNKLVPAISVALLEEYCDVMGRPALAEVFSRTERDAFADYLCSVGLLTEIFFLWRPFLKDPKDDMVLEVAVAAGAELIITHNIKDFRGIEAFGLNAVQPDVVLKRKEYLK
ncbi:MAG: putative toxin-antitoxin system toxin component, PIN family [Opitutales bacterium]|nr:putative toxin-antitoxin system toxin component, PIN family [Opitutales bacterium]